MTTGGSLDAGTRPEVPNVDHLLAAAADGAGPAGLESGAGRWLRFFWHDRRELWGEKGWELWGEVAMAAARAGGAVGRLVSTAHALPGRKPVGKDALRDAHRLLGALKVPCLEADDHSTAIVDELRQAIVRMPPGASSSVDTMPAETIPPADDHALLLRLTAAVEKGAVLEFGAGCHRVLQTFCRQETRRVLCTPEGWDVLGTTFVQGARAAGTFGRLFEVRAGQYHWLRRQSLWLALEMVGTFVPVLAGDWKPNRTIDTVRHTLERK